MYIIFFYTHTHTYMELVIENSKWGCNRSSFFTSRNLQSEFHTCSPASNVALTPPTICQPLSSPGLHMICSINPRLDIKKVGNQRGNIKA